MVRRWMLFALVVMAGWLVGAQIASARPSRGAPLIAEISAIEPLDQDTALLRWQQEDGARYRLCVAHQYTLSNFTACFDAGRTGEWPVGIPTEDGGVYYFALQGCRDGECSGFVPAGAVGRRISGDNDFYATALAVGEGRARIAAHVRSGAADIRYYRARSGMEGTFDSHCPDIKAGGTCGATTLVSRGSLIGAGAKVGARELGISMQVRPHPTIYFMFDDGTGIVSGGKYLMQSILDEYGVKGSWFLTGKAMQTYPAATRALAAGGHRVGSHTWSHGFLTTMSDAAIARELDLTEQQYRSIVPGGTLTPCFRAPNGDFNARVLNVLRERGYHQYTQNVSAMDYTPIPASQITQNVMADAGDGALVSLHTQEMQTAIALRTLIPLLLAQGYQFGLVC